MNRILLLIITLPGLYFFPHKSVGQSSKIEQLIQELYESNDFNGNILVAHKGEVIINKSFGFFDFEANQKLKPDHSFYLASISKQFTALLIMQLVEEGKVNLNASILNYLPNYDKGIGKTITIHHLLSHSSGLQEFYEDNEFINGPGFIDSVSKTEMFERCQKPILFEAGTSDNYSDTNYYLLSLVIEKLRGKPYNEVLVEKIFKPLKMNHSGYFGAEKNPIAKLYTRTNGELKPAPSFNRAIGKGATGCYSSTKDLYKWYQSLITNQLLSEEYRNKLWELHTKSAQSEYFGYGWRTHTNGSKDKSDWYSEKGGGPSFGVYNVIAKDYTNTSFIAILTNTDRTNQSNYDTIEQVLKLLDKEKTDNKH
ncbi:serine hydrolase domain-containing protein [Tenacibaculum caenipelagi]|uniref:CubicO group peptidase (Beta-lactamase class C family) n=1 Tax=Tenacibaculum caenipelagi TaxID=1325435 RepID=A0A4V3D2X6_9FLAO|nr:serine hydrolase domain-containing protein [Tenacibaculum caenipelagi]TDQ25430.1 CubicO group peptidase (beta-lactamase class C family) [Tenacibaculum caenipelagi]